MMMAIRPIAGVLAAALLCACAARTDSARGPNSTAGGSVAAAAALPGPLNAPVPASGRPGAIPLEQAQRAALDRAIAGLSQVERRRLRYALPPGDDGKPQVIVYDGEGLPADGRRPGRSRDYVVFPVLNGVRGEHYDPEQNALIAPIPPPPQRDAQ